MKTWEYKIIDHNAFKKPGLMKDFSPEDVEGFLNELGKDGWEFISFDCKFKIKEIETFYGLAKRQASVKAHAQAPAPAQAPEQPEP